MALRAMLGLGLWWLLPAVATAAPSRWLEVRSTFPPAPTRLDQLPGKGAYGFLDELVLQLAGVSTKKTITIVGARTSTGRCRTTKERVRTRVSRVSEGYCGTRAAGYRWVEQASLETSAVPVAVRATLYGVAGIGLGWRFSLHSVGQAGPSAFRHGSLRVLFAQPAQQALFVAVWQRYFGTSPSFLPVPLPGRGRPR